MQLWSSRKMEHSEWLHRDLVRLWTAEFKLPENLADVTECQRWEARRDKAGRGQTSFMGSWERKHFPLPVYLQQRRN